MSAHMTIDEARAIKREPVLLTNTYRFYSDCVGCTTDAGDLIRSYSGQEVFVQSMIHPGDEDSEKLFEVRAANGVTFQANEGELNGWIFDTGQWVGPRVN